MQPATWVVVGAGAKQEVPAAGSLVPKLASRVDLLCLERSFARKPGEAWRVFSG